MLLEIVWNDETTPADLRDGRVTVGGGERDDLKIAGLPHGLLTLQIEGELIQVSSIRSVRIGAALFPARVPRLLVEGEELKLPNDVILRRVVPAGRRESRQKVETSFLARELLGSTGIPVEQTRAATLTCVAGNDQGVVFPIAFAESVIGRADDADLRVRDRAASRRHAILCRAGNRYTIRELTSTNGVYVNGVRARGEREVRSGDILELGQTMLRFDGHERSPGEMTDISALPAELAPEPPVSSTPEPAAALAEAQPSPAPVVSPSAQTEELPPHLRRAPVEALLMSLGALLMVAGVVATVLLLT